jgi:CCCH-type zinc finger/RNA-binding, Nab2-type zinc finger
MQRMEFPGQRQAPSPRQPYQGGGRGGGGRGGGGGAYVPAGAMPSHNGVLSAHAKEFWFPECRNCECCKGFKHGCDCCKNGVDTCTKAGCVSTEHTSQVAADLASKSSSASAGASTSAPAAASSGAPRSPAAAAAPAAAAGEVCKFFLTGGCRFGASCRFVHPGGSQGGGGGGGSSAPVCQFFLSGNCMYGDKCRNAHVKPAAPAPAPPAAAAASTPAVPPPAPAEGAEKH